MTIRLITYKDPFSIVSTASECLEGILKEFPHLCISDTLAQGLRISYKPGELGVFFTLRDVLEAFYKEWVLTSNSVKRFLSVCEAIDTLSESDALKASLRFNRFELLKALEWLTFMKLSSERLESVSSTPEQNALTRIYEKIQGLGEWRLLDDAEKRGRERLSEVCLELLTQRITELDHDAHPQKKTLGKQDFSQIIDVLINFRSLWEKKEGGLGGILVHGVHQFEPLMLRWFFHLDSPDFEIVFLHNMLPQFPGVYRTWKKVTEWIQKPDQASKIIEEQATDVIGSVMGERFASLLEGKHCLLPSTAQPYFKFDTRSSFTTHIAEVFEQAQSSAGFSKTTLLKNVGKQQSLSEPSSTKVLSKMKEHFYVPFNNKVNNILRCYFPEQFGERHFLAYPVGQFVLGLYNMWDVQKKCMIPSDALVRECLAVGWFDKEGAPSLNETFSKLQLYFKNLQGHNAKEWLERFDMLIEKRKEITSNDLKHRFSFYAVELTEVERLKAALQDILEISEFLFGRDESELNYSTHFKILLETLKNLAEDRGGEREENSVLVDLLSAIDNLPHDINGTMQNLRETLHYYLSGSGKKNDSSRWIVRNFEQLDGAVFLTKRNKTSSKLHVGLLSNEQMLGRGSANPPWPLDEKMLESLSTNDLRPEEKIPFITLQSLNEYPNFLRFSLFYALFFSQSPVILSYVSDIGDEKDQTPYFMLEMIGVPVVSPRSSNGKGAFFAPAALIGQDALWFRIDKKVREEELQALAYCPYRFLLEYLLQKDPFFENELHCRYLYRVLLMSKILEEKIRGLSLSDALAKEKHRKLKMLFPFWQETDFIDLFNHYSKKEKQRINSYININKFMHYIKIRERFLVARLDSEKEEKNSKNLLRALHNISSDSCFSDNEKEILRSVAKKGFTMAEEERIKCRYCPANTLCLQGYRECEY